MDSNGGWRRTTYDKSNDKDESEFEDSDRKMATSEGSGGSSAER